MKQKQAFLENTLRGLDLVLYVTLLIIVHLLIATVLHVVVGGSQRLRVYTLNCLISWGLRKQLLQLIRLSVSLYRTAGTTVLSYFQYYSNGSGQENLSFANESSRVFFSELNLNNILLDCYAPIDADFSSEHHHLWDLFYLNSSEVNNLYFFFTIVNLNELRNWNKLRAYSKKW